jgi:hypothetical protein
VYRRPYPTVHVEHEESVPFPWGSGSKLTLKGGHLPLKSSTYNSHQAFEALADETADAILRESARLPEREKEIVLGIVRQFGSQIDDAQR